jgi:xylulokinase
LKPLLLGVDIGTSGAKAVLVDPSGSVRAEATTEYPMAVPRSGWAEQNPEDWWKATVTSIRQVLVHAGGDSVAGIGLTGQMHGLVLLDGDGRVLRPCIMWNDQRTADQCAEITRRVGAERLLRVAGKPALTGFTAGKILWVRENEPELYGRARYVLLPKDYVRYRLTGSFAMDVADGSGTLLMDVGRRAWSDGHPAGLVAPASRIAGGGRRNQRTGRGRNRVAPGNARGRGRGRPGGAVNRDRNRPRGHGLGHHRHVRSRLRGDQLLFV